MSIMERFDSYNMPKSCHKIHCIKAAIAFIIEYISAKHFTKKYRF